MSWLRPHRRRAGESAIGTEWSPEEAEALEHAVARAPSVHNTQPWGLNLWDRCAELRERPDIALEQHDPEGRDRRISCGAALVNLMLAVRGTGWSAEMRRGPGEDDADLIATVRAGQRKEPGATEGQRYRAINRRSSYRRPFHEQELSHVAREALLAAAGTAGASPRWVIGTAEAQVLSELLGYAARVHRRDRQYQRELAMWMVDRRGTAEPGQAVDQERPGAWGVPAVGLTSSTTRLPDEQRLAEWIAGESVLVLSMPDDSRNDHVAAGEAMQTAWLTATSLGISASVITQPLHLAEVRHGLRQRLAVPGWPHVLMRFGYPSPVPGQRRG